MGWSYRKSVTRGPFRVNVSKSGVGFSVGGKGFRTGVSPNGRTYRSYSIPGTGLRYQSRGKGCMPLLAAVSLGMLSFATLLAIGAFHDP